MLLDVSMCKHEEVFVSRASVTSKPVHSATFVTLSGESKNSIVRQAALQMPVQVTSVHKFHFKNANARKIWRLAYLIHSNDVLEIAVGILMKT